MTGNHTGRYTRSEPSASRERACTITPTQAPGRPLTPAGERLLAAASELFYARGIRAVGVDEVAEVAGTTKKTLYDQFRSKDRLVAAYLDRRAQRWQTFVTERLEDRAAGTAADRVLTVFDAVRDWHATVHRGCAFVNAWAELGGTDHPACDLVRDEKRWMHALFARLVDELPGPARPGLADHLQLLYEGAMVVFTAGGDPGALDRAYACAAALLDDDRPRPAVPPG